eukprot:SAG11_NODE_36725_length_260_cov_0.645963_1_plen_77_part_01
MGWTLGCVTHVVFVLRRLLVAAALVGCTRLSRCLRSILSIRSVRSDRAVENLNICTDADSWRHGSGSVVRGHLTAPC